MQRHPLLALLLATLATGSAAGQAAVPADFETFVPAAMRAWQVPGLAIAVVKDGKTVFARGYGIREIGKTGPVDEHTLFAIASNSKAFTCAALGILVEEGKLSWADKVTDILPWFHLQDTHASADLRVLDLVVHRVGLPEFGGDHLWIGQAMPRREVLERIRHQKLVAPFRFGFHYQNILYTAAGELIPAKTGKTWTQFVQARILDPLGMTATTTSVHELKDHENVATPHEVRGGAMTTMAYDDVDAIKAAAGINSNVVDVAKWLQMHLAGGKVGDRQVLAARTVRDMQQTKTPLGVSAGRERVLNNYFRGYGLGWFTEDYRGHKLVSHGGALSGMISETMLVPSKGLGIVVLTNMAMNSLPTVINRRIIDHHLGVEGPDWQGLYAGMQSRYEQRQAQAEKAAQAARQKGTSPSLPLAAYTGTYHNPLPGRAKVELEDGKLYFFYNARHRGYLTHWQHDTFRITWIDNIMDMDAKAFVRFELDEKSAVRKLHTRWYHPITFDRVGK